jgi:uncharacterized Zn-finger protein
MHECPYCSRTFTRKYNLTNHTKTHFERDRKFKCFTCPSSFVRIADLRRHEVSHTVGLLKCDLCHAMLSRPDSLNRHYLKIHRIDMSKKAENTEITKTELEVPNTMEISSLCLTSMQYEDINLLNL